MAKKAVRPVTVFIDTNVIYDYNRIDSIKWSDVFKGAPSIHIYILQVNLRELNNHKDGNSKPRRSETAGKYLKYFHQVLKAEEADRSCPLTQPNGAPWPNVRLFFARFDAPVNLPLNPNISDDQFLADMLAYIAEHPDRRVVLLTSDNGMALQVKTREYGIEHIELDNCYRAPELENLLEKANRHLRAEINVLKDRAPKLELTLDGYTPPIALRVPPIPPPLDIETEMRKVRMAYGADPSSNYIKKMNQIFIAASGPIDIGQLVKYFDEYQAYLRAKQEHNQLWSRMVEVSFAVENTGTVPASGIVCKIRFHEEFTLSLEEPKPPKEPVPPRSHFDPGSMFYASQALNSVRLIDPEVNVSRGLISDEGTYSFEIRNLDHNFRAKSKSVWIAIPANKRDFRIGYMVHAKELPVSHTGSIDGTIEEGA